MASKVVIATKNPAKIAAVEEILLEYPRFADATVVSVVPAPSGTDQPRSLEETIDGAENRAIKAFSDCDYSIGIESGVMTVPKTKSGYMDVCACVIYDGKETHLGLSSAWEFPDPAVMKLIVDEGMNMSDAAKKVGMTESEYVGWEEGAIGIVTKGRMDRKAFTKQALRTALIHVDN